MASIIQVMTHTFDLDLKRRSGVKILCVNGDQGNQLVISLTSEGETWAIPENTHVRFAVVRADGREVYQSDTDDVATGEPNPSVSFDAETGVVTVDLRSTSISEGDNYAEIQIVNVDDTLHLITSAEFIIRARRCHTTTAGMIASIEYPILRTYINALKDMTVEVVSLPGTSNPTGTLSLEENAYLLSLGIPRGASAYEIAVANGEFIGTEAEWAEAYQNAVDAANAAATLANTKAGLANDAAALANTKAGLADTAASAANTAASAANTAASAANAAATLATTKAELADGAATAANTAAALANTKAGLANDAADLANTKAALADTKAGLADTAASAANAAATLANTKAGLADDAATAANTAAAAAEAAAAEIQDALEAKADTDGYYSTLGAGTAEQLMSPNHLDDRAPFSIRSTGGGASGVGKRKKVKNFVGGSIVWNQQVANGNFSSTSGWTANIAKGTTLSARDNTLTVTASTTSSRKWTIYRSLLEEIPANHVVVGRAMIQRGLSSVTSGSAVTGYRLGVGTGDPYQYFSDVSINAVRDVANLSGVIKLSAAASYVAVEKDTCKPTTGAAVFTTWNVQIFDLTAMFGADVADHVYALEQANAGAGVAWFNNLFPEDYYGDIEKNLQSVKAMRHITKDANNNTIGLYPLTAAYLRGIPMLDENDNLYYDGDEYNFNGVITRNYEEREYESGDENLANAITDGYTTVVALATPTTETALAYPSIQVTDPSGTEVFVDADVLQGNRDVIVPVGHETEYYADLVSEIERVMVQVPAPPSATGSYHLAVTVANGVATYSWEADS